MATRVEPGPPASARPTGTVSFLFSDIEGSAARWDADREAMAAALSRHDALMRATLEAHGGYIFKTIGDAFCAAFATVRDAIAASLEAQRALSAEDFSAVGGLRVRMAVHTGTVNERDGDYFGPTVNRVARLLAIGHGGQVLISGAAAELLHGEMPPQTSLRDLGEHRLRDLAYPERIYQLVDPDLPQEFPALRSLDVLPNNLPLQLTSFVGRESEVAEVKALIESHRLVTLLGSGGAGKTRCAIQVGAEMLDGSGEGVWLVELAPISDPALVPNAIAQALNVQEQPNRPLLDTLVAYIKRKRLLFVLDGCEHVIEEVRRDVAAILHDCPDVYILATSREPLNISAEATYRMPSLAVPSSIETLLADGFSRYGALQLFVDRALFSNNRFSLTAENAPHIVEICRKLDGIPLAIELAAARVKVLSPKQLDQKLDERFRVLTGGDRSALPRHQTMRALIDWSYDLLSNDERALFRKLAVFAGGFTLESAAAVCSDGEMDEIVVLDLLTQLVDKSLVQAEETAGETRYRLLESTRQYAREKLSDAGESDAAAHAHARAFVALAEQLKEAFETTPDRVWYAQAEPELENVRAALAWTLGARGDVLLGQRLTGVILRGWSSFVGIGELQRWVQEAQRHITADTPLAVRAALDNAEAALGGMFSQYKASLTAAERALGRYRELADPLAIAVAEIRVARVQTMLGDVAESESLLEQALQTTRALGARKSTVWALEGLAIARQWAGDLPGARQRYSEALAAARSAEFERGAAGITIWLAEAEFRGGDAEAALRLARETLGVYRKTGDAGSLALVPCNMAAYLSALRRYDEARTAGREALTAARDAQFSVVFAFTLQHLAAIAASGPSGDRSRAARILGYVDAQVTALEALREYTEQQEYDVMLPALREALGEDGLSKLMAEGSTWSEDQAAAEAMLI